LLPDTCEAGSDEILFPGEFGEAFLKSVGFLQQIGAIGHQLDLSSLP